MASISSPLRMLDAPSILSSPAISWSSASTLPPRPPPDFFGAASRAGAGVESASGASVGAVDSAFSFVLSDTWFLCWTDPRPASQGWRAGICHVRSAPLGWFIRVMPSGRDSPNSDMSTVTGRDRFDAFDSAGLGTFVVDVELVSHPAVRHRQVARKRQNSGTGARDDSRNV